MKIQYRVEVFHLYERWLPFLKVVFLVEFQVVGYLITLKNEYKDSQLLISSSVICTIFGLMQDWKITIGSPSAVLTLVNSKTFSPLVSSKLFAITPPDYCLQYFFMKSLL